MHETARYSPASNILSQELTLKCNHKFDCRPDAVLVEDDFVSIVLGKINDIHDWIFNNINRKSDKMEDQYDICA